MPPQGTGWIPDLPDPRDYGPAHRNLAPVLKGGLQDAIAEPPAELPSSVDLRPWFPPVIEQGILHACTAATAAALIGYFEKKTLGREVSPSVMFLYKIERKLLRQRGDTGAFLRTAMQALRAFGIPPDTSWPYDPSLLDIEPAPFHYAYAANYKATHYFRLDDDGVRGDGILARARASLAANIPVMFGLVLYSSLDSAAPGEIPLPGPFDTQTAL